MKDMDCICNKEDNVHCENSHNKKSDVHCHIDATNKQRMLEHDAYCTDILVQVSAINAALNSFNKVLLANHVRTCVADNIRKGNDDVIDELVALLQKMMK